MYVCKPEMQNKCESSESRVQPGNQVQDKKELGCHCVIQRVLQIEQRENTLFYENENNDFDLYRINHALSVFFKIFYLWCLKSPNDANFCKHQLNICYNLIYVHHIIKSVKETKKCRQSELHAYTAM